MKKIDLRQPKYIFPLVILLPLLYLGYTVCDMFSGGGDSTGQSEGLQTELPDADVRELQDKFSSMSQRYNLDDDALTAMSGIELDRDALDTIESAYSDDERERIMAEAAERERQEKELQDLQRTLAQSRDRISGAAPGGASYGGGGAASPAAGDDGLNDYVAQLQAMQEAQRDRQKMIAKALGVDDGSEEKPQEAPPVEKPEPPQLVIKSKEANADRFNTIGDVAEEAEASLIRAMIDKTTKAHQGTRLRFKLLDDVTIKEVRLKKGTYLYGTVTGFGQQRVMAAITSIMVGGKFLKVDLSVYDNDGMEGFYVPESAFRDFMKNAGAGVAQQSININSGSYGSEISGEALALQALQNVYNSASQAIAANIRKNRANIKYNTIVYLVNSRDAE